MVIYLFSQILKFTEYSIKLKEKLSRRHFINSSDVFVIKGFTVRIDESIDKTAYTRGLMVTAVVDRPPLSREKRV